MLQAVHREEVEAGLATTPRFLPTGCLMEPLRMGGLFTWQKRGSSRKMRHMSTGGRSSITLLCSNDMVWRSPRHKHRSERYNTYSGANIKNGVLCCTFCVGSCVAYVCRNRLSIMLKLRGSIFLLSYRLQPTMWGVFVCVCVCARARGTTVFTRSSWLDLCGHTGVLGSGRSQL